MSDHDSYSDSVAFALHVRPYQRPAGVQEHEKDHGWTAVQDAAGDGPTARGLGTRTLLSLHRSSAYSRRISSFQ
jgi:hypothetical protein